jgi:hypothetical protein
MTQPEYVPIVPGDRVRGAERLPVPLQWLADRPAETARGFQPRGARLGTVGPDQGFALKLAHRFTERLELQPGEHAEDAVAGCLGVGLRGAAMFGRAPVIYDFEFAFTLFGFLGGAPADLLEFRRPYFAEASHDYWDQRDIADLVDEETLALTPADLRSRLGDWRSLFVPVDAG